MDKLRLRFEKTGRAVYISHLDLMHTMQRVFSRAGFELKYSEGFNPHPQISVVLPLSVGTGSLCELMDFRLAAEADLAAMPARLTAIWCRKRSLFQTENTSSSGSLLTWAASPSRKVRVM